MSPVDRQWMLRALELAQFAANAGEVPVGALVVRDGLVVGEGWNQPITAADPTAHAEIVALRAAARNLNNYRLPECDLYVTLEPCTMCVGAIIHARVRRLLFATNEPKSGAVESRARLLDTSYANHRVEWQGGVCAAESSDLLRRFFQARREAKRKAKAP